MLLKAWKAPSGLICPSSIASRRRGRPLSVVRNLASVGRPAENITLWPAATPRRNAAIAASVAFRWASIGAISGERRPPLSQMKDCRRSRVSWTPSASPGAPIVLSWVLKFRSWMALDSVTLAANTHSARSETSGTMNRRASMSRIDRVRAGWRGEFAGCRGESMAPLAMDLKGCERSLGYRHRALWAQANREPGRVGLARRHRSIPPDDGITLLVVLEQFRRHVVAPAVTSAEFLADRHLHCALPPAGSPPPPAGKTSGRLSMPTSP